MATTSQAETRACDFCGAPNGFESNTGKSYCCDCWNKQVADRKAVRRAQLAAMLRCEADGCRARGTWEVGGHTRLCKKHLGRAKANRARAAGPLGFIVWAEQAWTDRESILRFANETAEAQS